MQASQGDCSYSKGAAANRAVLNVERKYDFAQPFRARQCCKLCTMSNKRKREDEADGTTAVTSNSLTRPTQEIVKYFEELRQHFDSLDDKEEQALLVANALQEANAQEVAVAADPGCSRVLEVLLPAAEPQQVASFFRAVLKGDAGLLALASRCDPCSQGLS